VRADRDEVVNLLPVRCRRRDSPLPPAHAVGSAGSVAALRKVLRGIPHATNNVGHLPFRTFRRELLGVRCPRPIPNAPKIFAV
jgi:hypothetical protein